MNDGITESPHPRLGAENNQRHATNSDGVRTFESSNIYQEEK